MEYLHTMVRVSNLEQSLDFYCNKFGLVEVRRTDNEKGRYTLVFLAAPGDVEKSKDTKARCWNSPTTGTRTNMPAAAISAISPTGSTTSTRPAAG